MTETESRGRKQVLKAFFLFFCLVCATPAAALAPAPSAPARAQRVDPIRRLEVWVERRRRSTDAIDPQTIEELVGLIGDIRTFESKHPDRTGDAAAALLQLASLGPLDPKAGSRTPEGIGRRELSRWLDRPEPKAVIRTLARTCGDLEAEIEQRLAAVQLLDGRHLPGTMDDLLVAARSPDVGLRDAAQAGIAGWPDAGLHLFFIEGLETSSVSVPAAKVHFEKTRNDLGDAAMQRLRNAVADMYLSNDWRRATRARLLIPILEAPLAVPLLIESLRLWNGRRNSRDSSLRIQFEIVQELKRISGRSIGSVPERWETWWERVNDGTISLPTEDGPETYTSASFFGLPVVSNRLIFVLDRSGSMKASFGTGRRTRYQEAVAQLLNYLEAAGEDTRFSVVLFSDKPRRWRKGLTEATQANRLKLERWLRKMPVDGGTQLQEAVFEAVRYERGKLNMKRLEADTVVVLCDGETYSGPGWVRPWLTEVEDAELIFHCVQLGNESDGTLGQLSAITNGQLVEVSE